jgi:hypothetical protein
MYTCSRAAEGGHLEVIQWARANGCRWNRDVRERGGVRAPTGAAVVAHERLPVGRVYVLGSGEGREPRDAAVGARERLPVGQVDVRVGGAGRAPRSAAVGASKRLSVGR